MHDQSQLNQYNKLLLAQIFFETRKQYVQLLKEFVQGKLNPNEFCIEISNRGRLNDELFEIFLKKSFVLSPNLIALDFFDDFISDLESYCKEYLNTLDFVCDNGGDRSLTDKDFLISINKLFLANKHLFHKPNLIDESQS